MRGLLVGVAAAPGFPLILVLLCAAFTFEFLGHLFGLASSKGFSETANQGLSAHRLLGFLDSFKLLLRLVDRFLLFDILQSDSHFF